jgi:uncharacterized pyridoxamine 5'-phosphate oxidase family protein
MKTIEQIREFANQNPVAWLSTAEGDQPHVRGMWMWFADDTGFYFHTGTQKRLSTQLVNNPKVEFAFFNPGEDQGGSQMVRITGKVEMVEDRGLDEKLFQEREWLNDIKAAYPNDRIFIFKVPHGEAQYWDMSCNCREKNIPPIVF